MPAGNRGLQRFSTAQQPGGLPWGRVHGSGLLANRPRACPPLVGFYYFASDVNGGTAYQCQLVSGSAAWVQVAQPVTMPAANLPALSGLTAGDVALTDVVPVAAAGVNGTRTAQRLGGYFTPGICDGRLTLTSLVPVTTTDVTSSGSLHFTPYKGSRIALHDGTRWNLHTFTLRSIALTLTSGKNYDVFIYDSGSGLNLTMSSAWFSDTARFSSGIYAVDLPTVDGVYVMSTDGTSIDGTRRYLGTIRASAANTVQDTVAFRGLWNYYNRVRRNLWKTDFTGHTYNSATIRSWGSSTANRVQFVVGVAEDTLSCDFMHDTQNVANEYPAPGVALDSTTVNSFDCFFTSSVVSRMRVGRSFEFSPLVGFHFWQVTEQVAIGVGANTFNGFALDGMLLG